MGSFGIGIGEVLLILLVVVLIFGPGKVPEVARGLGKTIRQFNKYSSGLTSEFKNEFEKELVGTPDTQSKSTAGSEEVANGHRPAGVKTEGMESQKPNE